MLMSLSFIGIIGFQFFWIKQLMDQKQAQLDQDLNKALANFEEGLKEKEAMIFLAQGVDHGRDKRIVHRGQTQYKYRSEIRVRDEDSVWEEIDQKFEVVSRPGGQSKIYVYGDNEFDFELLNTTDSASSKVTLIERFTKQRSILDEAANSIALEFAFKESSFSERVADLNVDSLLSSSLAQEGLQDLNYQYMIKDVPLDSLIAGEELDQSDSAIISKPLLTGLNKKENGLLQFKASSQNSYLLMSLWPIIGGTLLLSLVMLFTFGFTIDRIYKQKRLSQIKSDFINNMTHEFKTPIATISLALDAMFHPGTKNKKDDVEKFGDIIRKENERMHRQVERLLQAAQFEKGEINMKLEEIEVHTMLKELGDLIVESRNGDSSPSIEYELNARLDQVIADQLHLSNAFRNLLENALKFSAKKAKIQIKTHNEGSDLVIEVKDHGIGMSKKTMEHIFHSFYRHTEGDLHQTKGFGLGLAYVKNVIDKLDGDIWVESKLKEGSSFFIRLKTILNG